MDLASTPDQFGWLSSGALDDPPALNPEAPTGSLMRRQATHIFATKRDLEPGIASVERQRRLRYTLYGSFETRAISSYESLSDVSDLGINRAGNHLEPCYLVLPAERRLVVRSVRQRDCSTRYFVDQAENPGSITVQRGGMAAERCLVAGHIGTIHEDDEARTLFREFSRTVTKDFKKIRSYLIGPEALQLLDSGGRLVTIGLHEDPQYDLRR